MLHLSPACLQAVRELVKDPFILGFPAADPVIQAAETATSGPYAAGYASRAVSDG